MWVIFWSIKYDHFKVPLVLKTNIFVLPWGFTRGFTVFLIVKYFEQIKDSNKILKSLKHIFYHSYFL